MFIDFWYGHKKEDVVFLNYSFYPNDGEFRGNLWSQDKKIIGDFKTSNFNKIKETFPNLFD